ncbi:MAG: S41 family peptidase [Paludibacteraceae bacterium]|jgi:hypothetical protein|nr:S41 family peptidase [Paludibacteraceae bacterium]
MRTTLLCLLIALTLSSCEDYFFEPDKASSNPYDNFEYLWNELDKKYSYFELKNIDWDEMKTTYEARLYPNMSETELFNTLADLMNELRDDHSNLVSPFNVSVYNVPLTKPANYHARTIDEFYIPHAERTGSFKHAMLSGTNIAYIRYASFSDDISNTHLDYLLDKYRYTDGIILDLRDNGGGSMFNIPMLLERFIDSRTLVAYTLTRNGKGRNDFSDRATFYMNPYEGTRYTKPIMVLIDRGSYSATTFFALSTKAIPNLTLVGDTTGGGGGMPNGGQLPNGWTYRFSISQLLDLDGNNYAEDGVPPDILVSFDWTDLTKDEIIERAIQEID